MQREVDPYGGPGPKSAENLQPFKRTSTGSVNGQGEAWRSTSPSAVSGLGTSSSTPRGQTHTERKLAQVELAVAEVSQKLEDWTEATKRGMEGLRSEVGALKLEHRFSQTLRSTASRDEVSGIVSRSPGSSNRALRPGVPEEVNGTNSAKRLDAVEAACQDLRLNMQEVTSVPEATERLLRAEIRQEVAQLRDEMRLGRTKAEQNAVDLLRVEAAASELVRRVEEAESKLQEFQRDHLSETMAVKGRLEVAVREYDQQLSRADEVQGSIKAELLREMSELKEGLREESSRMERNSAALGSMESLSTDMARRLEESERKLWELGQAQTGQQAESTSLRGRLEAAAHECQEQLAQLEALRSSLQEERNQRMAESRVFLTRLEACEEVAADANGRQTTVLLSRLEKLEDTQQDVQRTEAPSLLQQSANSLRLEFKQEVSRLQHRVEASRTECLSQVEASGAELLKRLQGALADQRSLVRDTCSKVFEEQTITLAGRLEAAELRISSLAEDKVLSSDIISKVEVLTLKMESLEPGAKAHNDMAAIDRVHLRLDELESSKLQTVRERLEASIAAILARISELEVSHISGLRERLEALEQSRRSLAEPNKDVPEATSASTVAPPDVDELRRALAATSGDVACLARDLASVREEHDAAITGIGGLTEFVARAAATSIQRTEQRLAEELASKREEFEKAAKAQQEVMSLKAQALLAEAASTVSSLRQQATVQKGTKPQGDTNRGKDVDMSVEDFSRFDAVALQLRTEAAAQAANSEARIAAAEAVFSADLKRFRSMLSACVSQLEVAQVDVHELRPRVTALESTLAARDNRPVATTQQQLQLQQQQLVTQDVRGLDERPVSPRRSIGERPGSPRRGSFVGRREVPIGEAWLNIQNVMRIPAGTLTPSAAAQPPPPVRQAHEGLRDKLDGIASSVHHILGALNKQVSGSVTVSGTRTPFLLPPNVSQPVNSSTSQPLDQPPAPKAMPSPAREKSPFRRIVAVEAAPVQAQPRLSGSALISHASHDEPSVPVGPRLSIPPEKRQDRLNSASPPAPFGHPVLPMRESSPDAPRGGSRLAQAPLQRRAVPGLGACATGPATAASAYPGLQRAGVWDPVGSVQLSDAASVTSSKVGSKSLSSRPAPSGASTTSVRSAPQTSMKH